MRRSPVPDGPFGPDAGSGEISLGPPRSAGRSPGTRGAPLEGSEREADQDEAVPRSVATAERGRWRVIALALTLTAVVAFVLTRGGEPDPVVLTRLAQTLRHQRIQLSQPAVKPVAGPTTSVLRRCHDAGRT
jgi:hypothetical protein